MARWQPDAPGRLAPAALQLFDEGGFAQATAADIAARAEMTERTFFRHFADKREVLFGGSGGLQQRQRGRGVAEPAAIPAILAAEAGVTVSAVAFQRRADTTDDRDFAQLVRDPLQDFRAVTAGAG